MTRLCKKSICVFLMAGYLVVFYGTAHALNEETVLQHIEVSLPQGGSFIEGSTFDVPVVINTNGVRIRTIKLYILYDKNKLAIVRPSSGTSVIDKWIESPGYDNNLGVVSYVGEMSNGLVTEAGLVSMITFKALNTGKALVNVGTQSQVVIDDELGTQGVINSNRSEYVILKKMSGGVSVFSETHPIESKWYNNNSPTVSWDQDTNVTGFSFVLDDKPSTIPDNTIDSSDTTTSFENLKDGLWYFHIKANKGGVWGSTGHFLVRIDTAPPAEFVPKMNYSLASVVLIKRTLISFLTTDNLSGVDHYQVGVIDESQPVTKSPVFVETESPFQVPASEDSNLRVIVRAFDKAGNVREGFITIKPGFDISLFIHKYSQSLLVIFLVILTLYILIRYNKSKQKVGNTFGVVDGTLKKYLDEKKELHQQNIIEKEHLESLRKELLDVEKELSKEIGEVSRE